MVNTSVPKLVATSLLATALCQAPLLAQNSDWHNSTTSNDANSAANTKATKQELKKEEKELTKEQKREAAREEKHEQKHNSAQAACDKAEKAEKKMEEREEHLKVGGHSSVDKGFDFENNSYQIMAPQKNKLKNSQTSQKK